MSLEDIPLSKLLFVVVFILLFWLPRWDWIETNKDPSNSTEKTGISNVLTTALFSDDNYVYAFTSMPGTSHTINGIISAYSPTVEECDSTPFINASGERVKEGTVANNCLSMDTIIDIDGKKYIVKDRMNSRYGCEYFDIFMWDTSRAIQYGRQHEVVKIYES